MNEKDSFLLDFWDRIFFHLEKISVFALIRYILKQKGQKVTYRFVDFWVMGNFLFAIISSLIVFYSNISYLPFMIILSLYGTLRIFEIIVYQINVVFFHPYRTEKSGEVYRVKSIRRMIIALFHNYIEVIFWFSTVMTTIARCSNIAINFTWIDYTISTILCVVVFDKDGIYSLFNTELPVIARVVFFEIMTGLIMTVISIARFIGILPSVKEVDTNEKSQNE